MQATGANQTITILQCPSVTISQYPIVPRSQNHSPSLTFQVTLYRDGSDCGSFKIYIVLFAAHCSLQNVRFSSTLHTACFTLHTKRYTIHTRNSTVQVTHYTLHVTHYTACYTLRTVCNTLHSVTACVRGVRGVPGEGVARVAEK